MSAAPLHFQSAATIAASIRSGEIKARDALEHFLTRVDQLNAPINAIVVQDREGARKRADAADRARLAGAPLGPLHGVPMSIKESYQFEGMPTTWGIPEMKSNASVTTALTVKRLAAAGANVFAKTNVPIRLADFQSYNEVYGTTNNPWDKARTPGGSSGGSAAALAAGLTGLEIGSDIGGSIRNPAHFCGVFGHKPTWNLCPMRGHALDANLAPSDISVIGPMARSAYDLEIALEIMAGPDDIDAPGLAIDLPALREPMSRLRIAVWADAGPFCPSSASVGACVQKVAEALSRAGAHVDDKARPDFDPQKSHETFSALLLATMASRLPDLDYNRLVERAQDPNALQARWQTMRMRDWVRYNEARVQLRWAWRRFFDGFDFMITPVMPVTAFPHDHRPEGQRTIDVDGASVPYFNQTFWAGLAGVALLPATVFPAGPANDGLPVGLQIIGAAYGDRRTIQLAQRMESMGFRFAPPPGY